MEWELAERSKKCSACGKAFETGNHYYTALFLETEKLKQHFPELEARKISEEKLAENPFRHTAARVELCLECWSQRVKDPVYDCEWKGEIFQSREEKKHVPKFDKHQVFILFKKVLEEAGQMTENDLKVEKHGVAYFLAVMLERKNMILHQKNEVEESSGIQTAFYADPKTEEVFKIPLPLLTKESTTHFQAKIQELLSSDFSSTES